MILLRAVRLRSLPYASFMRAPSCCANGQHQVTVLESRVLFRGKEYRSLSGVARVITGSRWSGPLFFGLKKRSREEASGDGVR